MIVSFEYRTLLSSNFRHFFWTTFQRFAIFDVSLPIPSLMLKTKGVKLPLSTCRTLMLYRRFFSFRCSYKNLWKLWAPYLLVFVSKTLTLNNAIWCLVQNPFVLISNRELSLVFALHWSKVSPISDCSTGWIFTFLVTWLSNSAVTFLIWLCENNERRDAGNTVR